MANFRIRRLFSYLLLLCLPLGWGWGCTACGGECEDKPFTEQVRSYFLGFKPGSYWIYRNVQNGDIDSVYLVSETIDSNLGKSPTCRLESGYVILKGFAGDKQLGYLINSNNNVISIAGTSDTDFYGDYDSNNTAPLTVAQQLFKQVITLSHCCLTGRASCYQAGCSGKYFRFLHLNLAQEIGLVRWEAENYPSSGKVTYELIRSKIVR